MENKITDEHREAAEKMAKDFYIHDRYLENIAKRFADAHPEPSPDAEKLARDIAEKLLPPYVPHQMWVDEIDEWVVVILPLLTNFKPQSVVVDK